jgi:transposase
MGHRYGISDADGGRIQGLLPGQPGQHGGVAEDNRRFVNAVLGVARTGAGWADPPERLGHPNTRWRRFDRWDPIPAAPRDPDPDVLILDSTAVRAHPCAAGAKKTGTGLAAGTIRRWAAAGADSGPKVMGVSTASGTRSS